MRVGRAPDLEPRTVSGLPCPQVWALHAPLIRKTPTVDLTWDPTDGDLQTLAALDLDLMDGDPPTPVVPDLMDGGLLIPEVPDPTVGDPQIPGPVAMDPHRQAMAHRLLVLMATFGQALADLLAPLDLQGPLGHTDLPCRWPIESLCPRERRLLKRRPLKNPRRQPCRPAVS